MVRAPDEVEAAFAAIAKERAGAVVVQAGIFFQNAIADLAIKYQPTIRFSVAALRRRRGAIVIWRRLIAHV